MGREALLHSCCFAVSRRILHAWKTAASVGELSLRYPATVFQAGRVFLQSQTEVWC